MIPSIWFVLSGFLYPRTKILIPFMPLITWICAEGLEDIKKAKWQHVIPALAMCLIPAFFSDRSLLIFIDWFLLAAWVMIINTAHKQRYVKTAAFAVMMVFPLCVSIGAGRMGEDYIRADDIRQGSFELAEDKIQEIASGLYRFDYISDSLANSNFLPGGGIKKQPCTHRSQMIFTQSFITTSWIIPYATGTELYLLRTAIPFSVISWGLDTLLLTRVICLTDTA